MFLEILTFAINGNKKKIKFFLILWNIEHRIYDICNICCHSKIAIELNLNLNWHDRTAESETNLKVILIRINFCLQIVIILFYIIHISMKFYIWITKDSGHICIRTTRTWTTNSNNSMKLRVLSFTTGLVEKVIPKFSTFGRRRLFPEWRGFWLSKQSRLF